MKNGKKSNQEKCHENKKRPLILKSVSHNQEKCNSIIENELDLDKRAGDIKSWPIFKNKQFQSQKVAVILKSVINIHKKFASTIKLQNS